MREWKLTTLCRSWFAIERSNPIWRASVRASVTVVAVTPSKIIPVPFARAWIRGNALLPGGDFEARAMRRFAELPPGEQRALVRPYVYRLMTRDLTPITRALTDIERLNAEVDRISDEIVDSMLNPKEEDDG